jgi:predicted nuclease of restriction endonuclease-like (RecB) superfamily
MNQKNDTVITPEINIDEASLFKHVSSIIEKRKYLAAAYANREMTLMFWDVGEYINSAILNNQRAEYGKKILTELSSRLVETYGKSFSERNLYRMSQFAMLFPNAEILTELAGQLSWTHFVELLRIESDEARLCYANDAATRNYGTKELRHQISRKAFERREIANMELSEGSTVPFNVFKDPCLLDVFGLKENFLEADLERAILAELESFMLEFGHGLSFIDRQKQMIIGGEDVILDLLFYHHILKRLVAVELKLGKFKAEHFGQMRLYLKWLNLYERQAGEESPIGIILCASANREKVELLELDKEGIAVAEYWTHLPPKAELEAKIKTILIEAQERLERRKMLTEDNPP